MANAAAFGFLIFPTMPTMMELMTRRYPDTPLHISNTFLIVSSQLLTTVFQSIVSYLLDHVANSAPIILMSIIVVFSLTLFPITQIDRPRPPKTLIQ